ncbi:hypothetical protein BH10BDE1_BH10BDE1_07200 [soil metagenome]
MNWGLTGVSILTLALTACASISNEPSDGTTVNARSPLEAEGPYNLRVPKAHTAIIEDNSAGDSQFTGLYNTFEIKATILNSEVREALIRRQAQYYQWDQAQQNTEREKAIQELSSEATVFLSFSTPERKNDNMADKKSIWRVFLDVGGRRYVGQAKKDRRLIAELQALFPFHTRWNTPYMLTFPVGMTAIESQTMKLTLTGPLGSRVLEFRSLGSTAPKPEVVEPTVEEPPAP